MKKPGPDFRSWPLNELCLASIAVQGSGRSGWRIRTPQKTLRGGIPAPSAPILGAILWKIVIKR